MYILCFCERRPMSTAGTEARGRSARDTGTIRSSLSRSAGLLLRRLRRRRRCGFLDALTLSSMVSHDEEEGEGVVSVSAVLELSLD